MRDRTIFLLDLSVVCVYFEYLTRTYPGSLCVCVRAHMSLQLRQGEYFPEGTSIVLPAYIK